MSYSVRQELRQVIVATPELELGFSRESGALLTLRRLGGANVIGYGPEPASLDVHLASGWMSQRFFARYLSHSVAEDAHGVSVFLRIGIGPILVGEYYRITGTLIARTITVRNVGSDDVQLLGIRLALPWGRVGVPESCRFEAPGNGVRPRLSLALAAQLQHESLPLPGHEVAMTPQRGLMFGSSPDRGPGLLALHSTSEDENLLCWYFSDRQPAWPAVEGTQSGRALSLCHEIGLAGWLRMDEELHAGVQYIMLVEGAWASAMQAFQDTWEVIGLSSAADVPSWVQQAAIYETHPAFYGGFRGLMEALPRLHALGVNVLQLMPIWAYDNRSGRLWDGNWSASGSPYAILDFERFEPTLGSEEDFRKLVIRAHELDMRVLLELVTQGCAVSARYVAEHPDWFCRDGRGRLVSSHGWLDTYSFAWDNQEYHEYMLSWSLRLVREYGIDGFRTNAPHQKEPNWDPALRRHASSAAFGLVPLLQRLRRGLKEIKPDGALLCEQYGPMYVEHHDFANDLLPHLMFYQAGLGRLSSLELGDWLEDAAKVLPAGAARVCFSEAHNTQDLNPLADALRGSRLSKLLLAAMVACGYIPMLWYGQEQGAEPFIRRLLQLRRSCDILREGETIYNSVPCDVPSIFNVVRRLGDHWLLCVFNLSPHRRLATLSLPVDRLELSHEDYSLHELIAGQVWQEVERSIWQRYDLLQLSITVDPYGHYFFALVPGVAASPSAAQHHPRPLNRLRPPRRRIARRGRSRRILG